MNNDIEDLITKANAHYPFIPSGLFYLKSLNRYTLKRKGVWLVCIAVFQRNSCFKAISRDPDLTRVLLRRIWVDTVFL